MPWATERWMASCSASCSRVRLAGDKQRLHQHQHLRLRRQLAERLACILHDTWRHCSWLRHCNQSGTRLKGQLNGGMQGVAAIGGQPHCTTSGATSRTGGRGEDRMCKWQQPINSGQHTPAAAMSSGQASRAAASRQRHQSLERCSGLRVPENRKIGLKKIKSQP